MNGKKYKPETYDLVTLQMNFYFYFQVKSDLE